MQQVRDALRGGSGGLMAAVANLLRRLDQAGFAGDAEDGIGARQVASTDNSIYQVRPAAIVYPRTGDDVTLLVRTLADTGLSLTPRGGNTAPTASR